MRCKTVIASQNNIVLCLLSWPPHSDGDGDKKFCVL